MFLQNEHFCFLYFQHIWHEYFTCSGILRHCCIGPCFHPCASVKADKGIWLWQLWCKGTLSGWFIIYENVELWKTCCTDYLILVSLIRVWTQDWIISISIWTVSIIFQSVILQRQNIIWQYSLCCEHFAYHPLRVSLFVCRMHLNKIPHEKRTSHFLCVATLPSTYSNQKNISAVVFTASPADRCPHTERHQAAPCSLCGVRGGEGASQSALWGLRTTFYIL